MNWLVGLVVVLGLGSAQAFEPIPASPPGIFLLEDVVENSSCTTVAVSPDGLLLTALHCLRTCLRGQGRMESASSPFLGLNELDVVTDPSRPVTCNNLWIRSLGQRSVTVLATGRSLIQYEKTFMLDQPSLFAELKAHGFSAGNEDYALLKVNAATPACGRLAQTDILPNAHLAALGFQQQIGQNGQPNTLHYDETVGFRYATPAQSAYSHLSTDSSFQAYLSERLGQTDIIYSSAPIKEGQSGGPVISEPSREIAGLVSGHTADGRVVNELFAVPLSHVLDELPADVRTGLLNKNTLCHATF